MCSCWNHPVTTSLAVASVLLALPAAAHEGDTAPSTRVQWTDTAPVIDGQLDDPAWAAAPVTGSFIERKPKLRENPPVDTTFRVLMDGTALYIGVHCSDDPTKVVARTRGRDSFAIFADDAITLKFDVAHDHRSTVGFTLNPAGARLDYRGANESDWRIEFDAVWDGASAMLADGWSTEFRIPWAVLGLDPTAPPHRIGLNLTRDHSRRNATYDWSLTPPPYSPIASSLYGHLDGLGDLKNHDVIASESSAKRYALIPYALTGYQRERNDDGRYDDEGLYNGGFDAKAELGTGWRGHLTVNTDFAQVDLDNEVVNFSRFGLFLPEKRDFFLSDLEVFSFGKKRMAQPFYSRRIGLQSGEPIPIAAGVKVTSQVEDTRVGLLHVTTRPTRKDDGTLVPWTSNLVARGLVGLGGGSNAGVIFTHRQSLDHQSDRNIVVGTDAELRGSEVPWLVNAFVMGTITGRDAGEAQEASGGNASDTFHDRIAPAARVAASLRHELVRPKLVYAYYHPEVRTDLGFLQRVGHHRGSVGIDIEPRVGRAGVEKFHLGTATGATTDAHASEVLDYFVAQFGGVQSETGYFAGHDLTYAKETVLEPFTVGRDTEIPVGDYEAMRGQIRAHTPGTHAINGGTRLFGQQYYGGTLFGGGASLGWRPDPLFRLNLGGEYNHIDFGDEPNALEGFDSVVINGRTTFGFTNDLGLNLYGGYNLLGDVVRLQSRLRWIYAPGSDLFVVYQLDLDDDAFKTQFTSLAVKATYYYGF